LFLIARHSRGGAEPAPPSTPSGAQQPAITVSPVPRTAVGDRYCPQFLAALPDKLSGLRRRTVAAQTQYVQAWGVPPVIVHCGVSRPSTFVVGQQLTSVNDVQWSLANAESGGTWTAVDHTVYVSVYVPEFYAAEGPLVDVGAAITKVMPRSAIRPGPAR